MAFIAPPPPHRIVAGFVLGPIAPVLGVAGFEVAGGAAPGAVAGMAAIGLFFVAYPLLLVVGLPAFLVLRRRLRPRLLTLVLVGAAVAALPLGAMIVSLPQATSASIDGIATVVAGRRTAFGWQTTGTLLLGVAILGGAGGCAFWGCLRFPRLRSRL